MNLNSTLQTDGEVASSSSLHNINISSIHSLYSHGTRNQAQNMSMLSEISSGSMNFSDGPSSSLSDDQNKTVTASSEILSSGEIERNASKENVAPKVDVNQDKDKSVASNEDGNDSSDPPVLGDSTMNAFGDMSI